MKEDFVLEQRLQDFYDSVPDIEDALPFKDFLLKHEDSRMAWYLLGKQYAAKGEEAKANYCFGQAGDIYEAFESKPAPVHHVAVASESAAPRRRRRWSVPAALLLLAAGLLLPGLPASAPGNPAAEQAAQITAGDTNVGAPADQPVNRPSANGRPGIISAAAGPNKDGGVRLGELLMQKGDRTPLILVKAESIGGWNDWLKSDQPVASVSGRGSSGGSVVSWHDAAWCGCRPSDASNVREAVKSWKPVQEEKAVLVSAIQRYRAKFGKMPESPKALAGDFPSNHMAGWTKPMTEWFGQLTGSTGKPVTSSVLPFWPIGSGAGRAVPAGAWHALMESPMEIVVDTVHHRLAVVSGQLLLRNYEVGLGGKRTPLGQFAITEKVRNPNGNTIGPFGSRGMTLSDTRYAIHGTDKPTSIGKDESQGCIRMNKEDLEELYDLVPMGTKVTVAKGGLPADTRVPPERFRLPNTRDETNPHKVYDWLT